MADRGLLTCTVLLCFLFVIANSTTVHITEEWVPDVGWKLTCAWDFSKGDSLQSVNLFMDNQQFMIYRPVTHGATASRIWSLTESLIRIDCEEASKTCVLKLVPTEFTQKNFEFKCEVSGEGPKFMVGHDNYTLVTTIPSSEPEIIATRNKQTNQVSLNCTSSGLPAPKFTWIAGPDERVVPENFSSSAWNTSSKLWQSWSTFVLQSDESLPIKCLSVVPTNNKTPAKQIQYNAAISYATVGLSGAIKLILAVLLSTILTR
ncbi:uncharacterized protein LOC113517719 [Galleria mellonella]|uniref:Uncharacterized protein LOC113517719 n=1 Tax=Galleria mellonella TaxID=7137 RepID=A0A6J1WSB8_GALME|nr:uncharacterized protein LOC113517719 [Galleria mellonella]